MAMVEFGDPARPVDLIFLHANGFNALTYRAILEPLGLIAHVVALDMRGHGRSTLDTPTEGRRSWMDFRDDLSALFETQDIAAAVLAGHSMGGAVSLFAAADLPRRVRRLVLLDPVMIPRNHLYRTAVASSPLIAGSLKRRAVFPDRQAALAAYRDRTAFKSWSAEMLVDYVTDGFIDLPTGEVTLACRPAWESSSFAAQDQDVWGAVPRTICPITILRAEVASTCRFESASAPTDGGRIWIETIAGSSHFLPMERPAICREALATALEA